MKRQKRQFSGLRVLGSIASALASLSLQAAIAAPVRVAKPTPVAAKVTVGSALADAKLTGAQKASLGLRLYREEMLHPTPAPKAPYTEIRTHDYVLAEITRKLVENGADVP